MKTPINLDGQGWKRYEYSLELLKGQLASREPVDFVVALNGDTRVLIDQVLFYPSDNVDGRSRSDRDGEGAQNAAVALRWEFHLRLPHWRDGVG